MRQARDLATTFHTSLVRVRAFARWDYGLAASVLGISRRSIFFWKHLCLSEPAGSRLQWVSSSWPEPAQCGKNNNSLFQLNLFSRINFKNIFTWLILSKNAIDFCLQDKVFFWCWYCWMTCINLDLLLWMFSAVWWTSYWHSWSRNFQIFQTSFP